MVGQIVLLGLIGLVVPDVLALNVNSGMQLNKTYDIQPQTVTFPTDEEAIARGEERVYTALLNEPRQDEGEIEKIAPILPGIFLVIGGKKMLAITQK